MTDNEEEARGIVMVEEEQGSSRKRKTREEEEVDSSQLDAVTMRISEEERDLALQLRAAVLEADDLKDHAITDLECAQYAIVCGGSDTTITREDFLAHSLERIRKVRTFQRQYDIRGGVEEGLEAIRAFQDQHPGFSMDLSQCPGGSPTDNTGNGHFVQVLDFGKFHPKLLHLESDWKVFLRGMYYYTLAQNPHLAATRNGQVMIFECDGMGYHNFCLDFERRLAYELRNSLPFRCHELSLVHTPLVATVFHALMKKVWDKDFQTKVHCGVVFGDGAYDGRLDGLFLHPTMETAHQRQLDAAQRYLETLYKNKRLFQL